MCLAAGRPTGPVATAAAPHPPPPAWSGRSVQRGHGARCGWRLWRLCCVRSRAGHGRVCCSLVQVLQLAVLGHTEPQGARRALQQGARRRRRSGCCHSERRRHGSVRTGCCCAGARPGAGAGPTCFNGSAVPRGAAESESAAGTRLRFRARSAVRVCPERGARRAAGD